MEQILVGLILALGLGQTFAHGSEELPALTLTPDPACLKRLQWTSEVVKRIVADGEFLPEAKRVVDLATFLDSPAGRDAIELVAEVLDFSTTAPDMAIWIAHRTKRPMAQAFEEVISAKEGKKGAEFAREMRELAKKLGYYARVEGATPIRFAEILDGELLKLTTVSNAQRLFLVEGAPMPIASRRVSVQREIPVRQIGELYQKAKGIRGDLVEHFREKLKSTPYFNENDFKVPLAVWVAGFRWLHLSMKFLAGEWVPIRTLKSLLLNDQGEKWGSQIADLYFELLGIDPVKTISPDELRESYFRQLFYDARGLQEALKVKQRAPKKETPEVKPGFGTVYISYPLSTKLDRHLAAQKARQEAKKAEDPAFGKPVSPPASGDFIPPTEEKKEFNDEEALSYLVMHTTSERMENRLIKFWNRDLSDDERKSLRRLVWRIQRDEDGPGRFAGLVTKTDREDLYEMYPSKDAKARLFFKYVNGRVFFVWCGNLGFRTARKDKLDDAENEWSLLLRQLEQP